MSSFISYFIPDDAKEFVDLCDQHSQKVDEFDSKFHADHKINALFDVKIQGDYKYFVTLVKDYAKFFYTNFPKFKYCILYMCNSSTNGILLAPNDYNLMVSPSSPSLMVVKITYEIGESIVVKMGQKVLIELNDKSIKPELLCSMKDLMQCNK